MSFATNHVHHKTVRLVLTKFQRESPCEGKTEEPLFWHSNWTYRSVNMAMDKHNRIQR